MKSKNEHEIPNRGFFNNLKLTYKYAKSGKKYLFLFLLANLFMTVISIVVPVITAKRLIALTSGLFNRLFILIIVLFAIEIFRNFVNYFCSYAYNKFYYDVRRNMQLELTRETLKIKQSELNTNSSGVFIERINTDTDNLTDIFAQLIDFIISIIGNIGVLIYVFVINIYIGLTYIILLTVIFFYNKYASGVNYKNRKVFKKSREKTGGFISEIVRGSKDVKILNAEDSFISKADEYMTETNRVSYKYHFTRSKFRLIGGSIRDLTDLGISMLILALLLENNISIEYAIIIANYNEQLKWTADWIEQIFEITKQYNLASNRIFGILEGEEFLKEKFGNIKINDFKGNIEFKDVVFSYEEDIQILKRMNFKIESNQTVGFVGPSGAGKTTIFNLISAINKPDSGKILFDGKDIDELDKDSIRGNLSVISQNAYIYNMSIEDNLKIVKKSATDEEIEEACKLACLSEFIESLPDKYKTIVGEGGVTLSGGQKQRLAIARALILKTKILLFDEATSSLDNETQTKIQEAINNLMGDYTILIIAHRLSTIIDADKIFVINDGKVETEGTHSDLLKNSEIYKRLYQKENDINSENK